MLIKTFHLFQLIRVVFWAALMVVTGGLFLSAVGEKHDDVVLDVKYSIHHLHDGNDLITLEEVEDIVFETFDLDLKGIPVDQLDLNHIERVLINDAFIVKTDAYMDANKVLHIDVIQRIPILRVIQLDGTSYYLDSEGVKLPLSKNFTARVPVVTGHVDPFESEFLNSEEGCLKTVFRTVEAMRREPVLQAWLEEIHVDHRKELILYGNVGNFVILFGDGNEVEKKLNKMKVFFQKGMMKIGWNTPCTLNLKYGDQVVVSSHALLNSQKNY
jgi:cell division protein FtsQ